MVRIALGERPDLLDGATGGGAATGFVALYPREAGVLEGWTGLDRLPGLPGQPRWYPTASPGDVLDHLTDQRSCTGIVLAEAPTAELALHHAQAAAASGIIPMIRSTRDQVR